jgi:hypothetical protein
MNLNKSKNFSTTSVFKICNFNCSIFKTLNLNHLEDCKIIMIVTKSFRTLALY